MKYQPRNVRRSRQSNRYAGRPWGRRAEPLESRLMLSGDVLATVEHDLNGNGVRDPGEPAPGRAGPSSSITTATAPLRAGEPSAVTDVDGEALITGVPDNTWDVREILRAGLRPLPRVRRLRARPRARRREDRGAVPQRRSRRHRHHRGHRLERRRPRRRPRRRRPRHPRLDRLPRPQHRPHPRPRRALDPHRRQRLLLLPRPRRRPVPRRARSRRPAGTRRSACDGAEHRRRLRRPHDRADFGNFNVTSLGNVRGTVWNDVNADGVARRRRPGPGRLDRLPRPQRRRRSSAPASPATVTDAAGVYTFPSVTVGHLPGRPRCSRTAGTSRPATRSRSR